MIARLSSKGSLAAAAGVLVGLLALGWGRTGHLFINVRATSHLPPAMAQFIADSTFFGDHASDADNRKGSDPSEAPKHYIDLELIPAYHQLTRNLDSLIAAMGSATVLENGILPWATADAYDSLVAELQRGDWARARLTASDIGHYVGDGHNPLHVTSNYNGQLTGNTGIHSRYESDMINAYASQLAVQPRAAQYVADPFLFSLGYCITGNALADSIMAADDWAKAVSGWTGSGSVPAAYTAALWERTQELTLGQMQRATEALASLWYSAWVDAGLLLPSSATGGASAAPDGFALGQNYPNPFNPRTTIRVTLPEESFVRLTLHDVAGREVAVLVEGRWPAGTWAVPFDGGGLPSGVYLYRLEAAGESGQGGSFVQSRKMILLR